MRRNYPSFISDTKANGWQLDLWETYTQSSHLYRPFPHPWATLTDGGPPFFPAAWPAQLCHQGSNSLLPRQVAHRLSKCLGPPLDIFTRPLWPWNDLVRIFSEWYTSAPSNFLMDVVSLLVGKNCQTSLIQLICGSTKTPPKLVFLRIFNNTTQSFLLC